MVPSTIKKAIGAVKDQTSISIAKVAGNVAPELEVLIVKATTHDPDPADDKYIREILSLSSFSKNYVNACVLTISRRLSKTHNWVVALKVLLVFHRLLVDGGPLFQEEILYANRKGAARLLNMSGFRDEAHSNSWDQSGFVRAFGMYLDQKVELLAFDGKMAPGDDDLSARTDDRWRYGEFRDEPAGYASQYSPTPYGDTGEAKGLEQGKEVLTPMRKMRPEAVLEKLVHMQRLLDRFLACRPTGAARNNRMVLISLNTIMRESFELYVDIRDALGIVLDKFWEMEYKDCVKSFDVYVNAGKQIDELVRFYDWCKENGLGRTYPQVQKITGEILETLEGYLVKRAGSGLETECSREENPLTVVKKPEAYSNDIKALPPLEKFTLAQPRPEMKPELKPEPKPHPQQQTEEDLVNLKDDSVTADDQGNRLALALFSTPQAPNSNGSWEAFPSNGEPEMTSAWQMPAAEVGKADWEMALVESASNLSKQKASLAGGFDLLLLNGMYDQGSVRQQVSTAELSGGSASSVALPGSGTGRAPMLALPAPDGTVQAIGQDPFAASLTVAPPSYVQISDMEKKQQMLVQEQQLWQQFGRGGMQGQPDMASYGCGYSYNGARAQQVMPSGMPPAYGMAQPRGYYHTPY